MALPENGFQEDFILTPADVTPEVMIDFARYCAATENNMLKDVFRERVRIATPFPTSASAEEAIFRSVFEQDS